MKKKKIVYLILIFLITIFNFNLNVNAAPNTKSKSSKSSTKAKELTCVYKKPTGTGVKKVLIQDKNGNLSAYYNKKNKKISEDGWESISNDKIISKIGDKSVKKDDDKDEYITEDGYLKKCPAGVAGGKKELKYYPASDSSFISQLLSTDESIEGTAAVPGSDEAKDAEKKKEDLDNEINGKSCSDINFNNAWLNGKSQLSCLYALDNGICEIIQLNLKNNEKPEVFENISKRYDSNVKIKNKINDINDVISPYNGGCPTALNVTNSVSEDHNGVTHGTITIDISGSGDNYPIKMAQGVNLTTGEPIEGTGINVNFAFKKNKITSCKELFSGKSGEKMKKLLKVLVSAIRVSIPLILIGYGVLDFGKAILASNEDEMKKAQSKFIRRLIMGLAFFLIPSVLKLLLTIASQIWPVISSDLCGII